LCCSGNTHVVDIYDENYDVEEDLVDGRCELYGGLACIKYIGGRRVFVRSDVQQRDMETRLTGEVRWAVTTSNALVIVLVALGAGVAQRAVAIKSSICTFVCLCVSVMDIIVLRRSRDIGIW